MPKEFPRSRRVGEEIQRLLAELIRRELKDPRVGLVTVTEVSVSKDLGHAKIYVSTLDADADREELVRALQHAAGFLRSQLAQRLNTRTTPELRFIYDASIEEGQRMDRLISEAVARDRRDGRSDGQSDGED